VIFRWQEGNVLMFVRNSGEGLRFFCGFCLGVSPEFYILLYEGFCSRAHIDFSALSIVPPSNPLVAVTPIPSCATVMSHFKGRMPSINHMSRHPPCTRISVSGNVVAHGQSCRRAVTMWRWWSCEKYCWHRSKRGD
jgi:hypothetical protein